MKKIVFFGIMSTVFLSGCAASMPLGELDPDLEHEYHNPPTVEDCLRLGWTRGVHNEIGTEKEDWLVQCMAGKIPFHLDGRPNQGIKSPPHNR